MAALSVHVLGDDPASKGYEGDGRPVLHAVSCIHRRLELYSRCKTVDVKVQWARLHCAGRSRLGRIDDRRFQDTGCGLRVSVSSIGDGTEVAARLVRYAPSNLHRGRAFATRHAHANAVESESPASSTR